MKRGRPDDDARDAQGGSPVALLLIDLLADPTSTLRGLLRVSDLFCVRLTCKEAWRCIQHRPLTRLGVLKAATAPIGFNHHVPLLRWFLRNGIADVFKMGFFACSFGESGDPELISQLLATVPKTDNLMEDVLYGVANAGHDELALQLLEDSVQIPAGVFRRTRVLEGVAKGGCLRTAAAIDDDPASWLRYLRYPLGRGHQRFVEWVLGDMEPHADAQYITDAASSGSLELVKWLHTKGYVVGGETMGRAAWSGNLDLCKWVADQGVLPTQDAMRSAVFGGHVHVLEWLVTQGCLCTSAVLRRALFSAGVPVVAWCLDNHPRPSDAGDLLALSCETELGSAVFEYLADERGLESSPTILMRAVEESHASGLPMPNSLFDAAILVKRYGTPLYPEYMFEAYELDDVGRLRFALSQGQEVSADCYEKLTCSFDPTLLNEVLLGRKVGGSIPESDLSLIKQVVRRWGCHPSAARVLADHSVVVCSGMCDCCVVPDDD
jgi:hypothetical protein